MSRSLRADPNDRLNRISEEGMCVGCGLCEAIAGPDLVRVVATPEGTLRPVPGEALDHATVDQIYLTCPGVRVEGLPDALVDEETETDLVWGPYQRIAEGYAGDAEIRFKGATGGVMTALAVHLLETGKVDFVLHARQSDSHPNFGDAHISRTRDEVLAGAGSRYGPTATLIGLEDALASGETFAFFGTPCDVSGLRNAATMDPRIGRQVPFMIAMVCGGYMGPEALEKTLARLGMPLDQLSTLRYRGHGCPGPTLGTMNDGTEVSRTYADFYGTDESAWGIPFRCKICPDAIGEAADIAASDTWPGGGPTGEQATNHDLDPGFNAMLIRTARARALVDDAVADGTLVISKEMGPRDMDDIQPHQVKKKYAAWSRHMGLASAGGMAPMTSRLRLAELAASRGGADIADQASGTRERILAGRGVEPAPKEA